MTRTILKTYEDTLMSVTYSKVTSQVDEFYVVEYYTELKDANLESILNYSTFTRDNRDAALEYFRKLVSNAIA